QGKRPMSSCPWVRACQQAGDRKIFIQIGPMEANPSSPYFIAGALYRPRLKQSRKPRKWYAQDAPVLEPYMHHDFVKLYVLRQRRNGEMSVLNFQRLLAEGQSLSTC